MVKRGFFWRNNATSATIELIRLVVLDSASLQEEEARYQQRRVQRHHGNHDADIEPLYRTLDVFNSLKYIGRSASYDQMLQIAPGNSVTFLDAGHILGSASIYLEQEEDGRHHRLLFSGNLGYS